MRNIITVFMSILMVYCAYACTDGKDNLIVVHDIGAAGDNGHVSHVNVQTYDNNGNPSCSGKTGLVKLPGKLKIVGGVVNLANAISSTGDKILLTLHRNKGDWVHPEVDFCKNGKGQTAAHLVPIPDSICTLDLCTIVGADTCTKIAAGGQLQIPGDLPAAFQTFIDLPALPSVLDVIGSVLNGPWTIGGKIVTSSGQEIVSANDVSVQLKI